MTQVQMTDQQLNRALAELMGWTKIQILDSDGIWARKPEDECSSNVPDYHWSDYVPDYCNDPAASLEVQAKAIEVDNESYVNNLHEILLGSSYVQSGLIGVIEIARLLQATPRQRAESAYLAIKDHP